MIPRGIDQPERVPLHVVAARLGDDQKTVLATYAHLLPNSDQQAAAVVSAAILADKPLTKPRNPSVYRALSKTAGSFPAVSVCGGLLREVPD
jgi:hypothetical protein